MSIKTILITIVVLVAVIGGAYVVMNRGTAATPAAGTPQAQDPNSQQVQAKDVSIGSGTQAEPGTIVSVLYEGKLANGTTFDSSAAHNNEPLTFQLGAQGLIPGFQVGVNGMKEGGERIIQIPPALGYGDKGVTDPKTGAVVIPPNETLTFSVKLVKVQAPPAPEAPQTTATTTPAAAKPAAPTPSAPKPAVKAE